MENDIACLCTTAHRSGRTERERGTDGRTRGKVRRGEKALSLALPSGREREGGRGTLREREREREYLDMVERAIPCCFKGTQLPLAGCHTEGESGNPFNFDRLNIG